MIAIIDQDRSSRQALARQLRRKGGEVLALSRIGDLEAMAGRACLELVFLDLGLATGGEWRRLGEWQANGGVAPVVILGSEGAERKRVRDFPDWVFDLLLKPVSMVSLELVLRRVRERVRMEALRHRLNFEERQPGAPAIDGVSRAAERLRTAIGQAAASDAPILISGESGAGRRHVARCIHWHSWRASQPLITLNVVGMTREGIERELSGRGGERRVGLLEMASGGTLLLHEINRLPQNAQAAVGTLMDGCVRPGPGAGKDGAPVVRVIATLATGETGETSRRGLHPALKSRFCEDSIGVPRLRERIEDIPLLSRRFLETFARQNGVRTPALDQDCMTALVRYGWPGNVRELEILTERAFALGGAVPALDARHFGLALVPSAGAARFPAIGGESFAPSGSPVGVSSAGFFPTLDQLEWQHIQAALAQTDGNRTHAARLLGITSRTLRNKFRWARLGEGPGGQGGKSAP